MNMGSGSGSAPQQENQWDRLLNRMHEVVDQSRLVRNNALKAEEFLRGAPPTEKNSADKLEDQGNFSGRLNVAIDELASIIRDTGLSIERIASGD